MDKSNPFSTCVELSSWTYLVDTQTENTETQTRARSLVPRRVRGNYYCPSFAVRRGTNIFYTSGTTINFSNNSKYNNDFKYKSNLI